MDSIPIVAICAAVSTESFGKNAVQDGSGRGRNPEQKAIFKACCKEAILAPSPEAVPDMLREAFRIASSGRPGPVYVEIPSNFWNVIINYKRIESFKYKCEKLPDCNNEEIKKIEKELYKSKRPLVVVGEGADEKDIKNNLNKFFKKIKAPYAVSPIAKNYVDEFDELYLGTMRSKDSDTRAHSYMRNSDFVLFLGDRMQEWETEWYDESLVRNAKIAQIDSDYSEIGRVFPVDFSSVGSITSFINKIKKKQHSNFKSYKKEVDKINQGLLRKKRYKDNNGINPFNINNIVEEKIDKDGSVVCDTGYNKLMAIMKFRTNLSQNFIVSDKKGPMGYSVPAALGVALATKKEVVCFSGDGGFQMSLNELGTAMEYGLKVIFIVHNNGGCEMIKAGNIRDFKMSCINTFKNPDFAKLAESYNLIGYKAETTEEFNEVFLKAQKEKNLLL